MLNPSVISMIIILSSALMFQTETFDGAATSRSPVTEIKL